MCGLNRQKSAEAIVGERIDTRTEGLNIRSHGKTRIRESGDERSHLPQGSLTRKAKGEARSDARESGA